ncbi:MAG: L-histidine N(alpha)-methyltransferase [Bacteroidia bacterium]|nr:L-histidine N(alpha)-methyltransferase [Bacteroidia bacterium]
MTEQFRIDVEHGLASQPKTLPSKYFYDEIGDDLFVKIMHMPEYYLTRAELEIFQHQTDRIISSLEQKSDTYFELIELGAGDGTKTKKLLSRLLEKGFDFDYLPVDISQHALDNLNESLSKELPALQVRTQQGDYFEILESLKESRNPKVVLFLGSNIGNLSDEKASEFIYRLGSNLQANDMLFLGVDLIKSEDIVLPAYNDKQGITRDFNLNLLTRINNELGGNFDLNGFVHAPEYSETEGIARSFIESTKDQVVTLGCDGPTFAFEKGEKIHTEISRKYNDEVLKSIIKHTDFKIQAKLMDSQSFFADYVLKRT